MGQLHPNVFFVVRNFLRCGDLASGFLRFHCSDCDHEHLLVTEPPKQTARAMRPETQNPGHFR